MGAAMTRCVAALARKAARRCKRGPMSATDAREGPRAVFTACQGLRRAARGSRWNRRNARTFATKVVSRHPGDRRRVKICPYLSIH